jgi:Flp pilus assembly protein TadD
VVATIAALRAAAGDAKGAATEYAQLAKATPNDPEILASYAEYQSQAGDKAGARATIQQALSASPKSFELMSGLANFDFDNGGFDKALATAKSFAPGEQLASDLIAAEIYERARRPDDAVATLTAAMKRNPQLSVALKLANELFVTGQRGQAVETLRAWIKGHPRDYDAQLVLAGFYDRLADPASAQQAYEDAYKIAPLNWVIANNLAGIYAAKSDARARALGEQAYYLAPSPQTADTYGWALVRTGDAAQGLRLLRVAQAAMPSNAAVLYHLAVAFKDTGDTAEARNILQKVVGSGATFDDQNAAKQLLEQLPHG